MNVPLPRELRTERLRLRVPRPEDAAEAFATWTSDAEVTRYVAWRRHASPDETRAYFERSAAAWQAGRGHLP
ncbi:MAG TPA: GNAT family N-acetyltransferase [Sandaracinaceae bacterium]